MIFIIIFIIFIAIAAALLYKKKDTFAGAMVQMYAKGPEDQYLTVGTDQYIPPYFYNPGWAWNMPTRLSYPYYPIYGIYPNYYSGVPYYRGY